MGFAGLGQMGAAMAARVADARFPLTVLDISAEAVDGFLSANDVRVATDPAALAASSDVIVTMLPDGLAVRRMLAEPSQDAGQTALNSLRPGTTVVDMSSSAPHETLELGALLAERGVELIDAPVSGGVRRARTGTLAIMAGGDATAIARVGPLLRTMGETVLSVGRLGAGHAAKALNNAVSAAGLLAACEALTIGERFGIEPAVLLSVLNSSTGRNNATENKVGQFILSRTFDSGFALELLAKDLRTADELARRLGVEDEFTELSMRSVCEAEPWLGREADHTEVASFLEHRSRTSHVRAEPIKGGPAR